MWSNSMSDLLNEVMSDLVTQLVDEPSIPKYKEPETGWVQVPIIRGIYEISCLLDLCDQFGGTIIGGYARYCCSQAAQVIPAGDVDIFPTGLTLEDSEKTFKLWYNHLVLSGLSVQHENEVSCTWNSNHIMPFSGCPTIQLIKPVKKGAIVTCGSTEDILSNFDFSVVRVALNKDRKTATAWAAFMDDENSHRLNILNIHCPVSSTLRCMKYSKKGYWMNARETLKLLNDWLNRTPEYRENILQFFETSKQRDLTQKEIDELEALLNVD